MVQADESLLLVGTAEPGQAAALAGAREADSVVVHVEAGDEGGIDAISRVLAEVPGVSVVALVEGRGSVEDAIAAGARAVLPSNIDAAALGAAIRAAAVGLVVVTLDELEGLRPVDPRPLPANQPVESLTARELQVLQLVAGGLTNQQVARSLGISEHTAKFHVGAVLGKLGARSRAEAVARAAGLGLIVV
jgi:DNA-binding NarL/FixJ family response regulator